MNYDAILVVSFGGPESKEDVIPFLETVLRGRNVPRERLLAVAEHYYHFEGKSPINEQIRELMAALASVSRRHAEKNEGRRRTVRDRLCNIGVQFIFRMPPVPGRHCAGASRNWRGHAGGGQAAGVL
jgi:Ferrochelatase